MCGRDDDPSQHDVVEPASSGAAQPMLAELDAKTEEMKGCASCSNRKTGSFFGPAHFASPGCQSNGRRWDPEKKELVGNRHCSCDYCF